MSTKSLLLAPVALIMAAVFFSMAHFIQQAPPPEIEFDLAVGASGTWDVEITSNHAAKHGIDAETAIRCIESQGPTQTYLERDRRTVHLLCLNQTDQKWYDVIVEMLSGKKYVMKSAFMAQDGTWAKALQWLTGTKGATRWTSGPASVRFIISP